MCIIASKPAGVDMPKENYISNMFNNNSDGAGLMYAVGGKVHIEKGFMTLRDFNEKLEQLDREYCLKKLPLVMHFRVATHGEVNAENCHPFPITESEAMLKKRMCVTNIGVAHNGIINIKPRAKISDTMEYIISQLAPLEKAVPDFYKNKWLLKMIYNAITSKMVIMDSAGNLTYIGEFEEKDGIKYSNTSYAFSYKWLDFPMSVYDKDFGSDELIEFKDLMWLDESKGEYIIDEDSEMCYGDFAIDTDNLVYELDYESCVFFPVFGARACNSEGMTLTFNPCSEFISNEPTAM